MVMSVSAKYVGGPFFNPETMQTATFYIISPDKKSPSHIRCVHTSVCLESLHTLLGPGCSDIELVSLPTII